MYAETVFGSSAGKFAQKHHLAVDLFDTDVVIRPHGECGFHFVQFVIVGGKEGLGV